MTTFVVVITVVVICGRESRFQNVLHAHPLDSRMKSHLHFKGIELTKGNCLEHERNK